MSLFISRFIYYVSTSKRQTSGIYGPDPKGKCRIGYVSLHFSAFFSVAHHLFFPMAHDVFPFKKVYALEILISERHFLRDTQFFIYLSQIKTTSCLRYVSQSLK